MPVFDFNNSPQDSKVPECTYKVFYTNCPESSPEHPILILDNKAGKLVPPFQRDLYQPHPADSF